MARGGTGEPASATGCRPGQRAYVGATSALTVPVERVGFIRLHKRGISHAGIVVYTEDTDTAAQAARVHGSVTSLSSLVGQLVRVNQPQKG